MFSRKELIVKAWKLIDSSDFLSPELKIREVAEGKISFDGTRQTNEPQINEAHKGQSQRKKDESLVLKIHRGNSCSF